MVGIRQDLGLNFPCEEVEWVSTGDMNHGMHGGRTLSAGGKCNAKQQRLYRSWLKKKCM